ncbi:hypothetical protein [Sphingomonas sp. PP-F2F-A104-K0414]|uniref:hypothetical protein n=1 Tax=Sphingomonas sp. PP-F2F-A104-K0414 TaxID=2135661 RepID=UPI001053BF9C|nr:hypothetical protein [Sphingomonas sp. PP-F2F-A104-K0414]
MIVATLILVNAACQPGASTATQEQRSTNDFANYADTPQLKINSVFNGRWRPDASTIKTNALPTVISLGKGLFRRDSKKGDRGIKADGVFHSTPGDGYVDQAEVTIINSHSVREVDKIRGRTVYIVVYTASPDGNTLTWEVTNYANPDRVAVHSRLKQRRIGRKPVNDHAISGTWQQVEINVVEGAHDWILNVDGNRISFRTPQGVGYDALIDGPPVRIKGDDAGGTAAVVMPNSNTIIETDAINGVIGSSLTMTVIDNGKTMKATSKAATRGDASTFYLRKQG